MGVAGKMRECLMTSIMHLLELGNWTHLGAVLARVVHNWLDQGLAVTLGSPVVGGAPGRGLLGLPQATESRGRSRDIND